MRVNYLLLLVASLAWASDYLFIGWTDRSLPPLATGARTAAAAALGLLLLVRFGLRRRLWPTLRSAPLTLLILGATAVALPRIAVVFAEEAISADVAALTGTTVPILTTLVAMFATHQTRYSHLRLLGVLVALGGLAIFVDVWNDSGRTTLKGMLIMMSGGVAFVFAGLYTSLRAAEQDKAALTVWVMTFGAVMIWVVEQIHSGQALAAALQTDLGYVVASGFASMALAYLAYFVLIERAGPIFAATSAYLIPAFGVLLGVLFLGESLTLSHVGGLALVLIGLWMITRPDARVKASAVGTQTTE